MPVNSFFCAAAPEIKSSDDSRSAVEKAVRVIPPPRELVDSVCKVSTARRTGIRKQYSFGTCWRVSGNPTRVLKSMDCMPTKTLSALLEPVVATTGPASASPTKVGFVSLGCPKNLVDSEVMMGMLAQAGAKLVSGAEDADVIVV